jgi:glycerol-3-phosphate O-acyltransferase / dihydroxyacetone phosphate acyltransferase
MVRSLVDRFLLALVFLILRAFFRSVEVEGRERIPAGRPVLALANHYNGMVDGVLLAHVFGRVPRFLAKSTLWNVRFARPLFALVGMVPVHRPEDRVAGDNVSAFEAAHRVLARRGIVAIFPEGATHDQPALARIRTGAARIALGAREAGVEDVVIVPVGLTFDDKLALRSRVLARVGEPIHLADELDRYVRPGEPAGEESRDAVRRLTVEFEARLRAVSPDYRDLREAAALSRAAEITRRTGLTRHDAQVPLVLQEPLAQKLAYAPPAARTAIIDALARYQLDLDLVGLRDHHVVPGYTARQLLAGFIRTTALVTALAPLWVPGLVVNAVPYQLVKAVGRAVSTPVMKGTSRMLTALAVFPVAWAVVLVASGVRGWLPSLGLLLLLPLAGLVAVAVFERIVRGFRAWRGWQALRDRRALLGDILADRRRLVTAVEDAAARVPAGAERRPAA